MDSWDLACSGVRYLITDTESDINLKYFLLLSVKLNQWKISLSLSLSSPYFPQPSTPFSVPDYVSKPKS